MVHPAIFTTDSVNKTQDINKMDFHPFFPICTPVWFLDDWWNNDGPDRLVKRTLTKTGFSLNRFVHLADWFGLVITSGLWKETLGHTGTSKNYITCNKAIVFNTSALEI